MSAPKEVGGYKLGKLIIEGKTKQVFDLPENPGLCLLLNKDRITAGDGVKAHDMAGKAAISNQTNAKVFEILEAAGLKTAFVKMVSPTAFISKKCEMIPIEWVTRRLATGSFLKRNPGVPEGFRFTPPKQETFFKDDANHDPQWSEEQIVCAKFKFNGLEIGQDEVDYMRRSTILVFEILEKAWALRDCALIDMKIEFGVDTEDFHRQKTTIIVFEILEKAWALRDCALIDMKIEFGVDTEGNIVLADIIDSDSWRLWPSGDKRLMVDKQVYRNLTNVTAEALDTVKRNFDWVKDQLDHLKPNVHHKVVIFMGSPADQEHCQKIAKAARDLGLDVELRVTSAHKATEETLRIMQQYEDTHGALVFIAVAGRSNGLGPVLSGNTSYPVINCPPPSDKMVQDIWSSLSVPSGLGCATVIYPDSAALMAAQIIGLQDYLVWARLRVKQLEMAHSLRQADKKLRNLRV
ncbi:SAICAR synthetase domain-containing protein [Phthorimaea operculella]|nr:SAICAR synthetase domain-containing protein [Phthorimaea operculella]